MSRRVDSQSRADQGDRWSQHARQWALVGAPLRSGAQGGAWLARRAGAPGKARVIATIDYYRDSDTRYSFPTLAEAREVLARYFVEMECHTPDDELGERCPTLRLAPARSGDGGRPTG